MNRTKQRLELTWYNKDLALIPAEHGKYGYAWVSPNDPRYCQTRPLILTEYVEGRQADKADDQFYSDRADLEPQTQNLLIVGESGDALEALTRVPELKDRYVGQVKCIYIDPPFNTGEMTFGNYEDNLEHSVWLGMMRDRLKHLRKLLSNDGTIWVHLDDTENHRMRLLLDELFGSGNFVAEVQWQKADSTRNDAAGLSSDHDTILVYRKSSRWTPNRLPRTAASNARFSSSDGDPIPWFDADPTAPGAEKHQGMVYAIQHPITGKLVYPARNRCWWTEQAALLSIMSEYAPYELRDIQDDVTRAKLCGTQTVDVREGVPAIMLAVPLEEAEVTARQRYEEGNWPAVLLRSGGTGGLGRKAYASTQGLTPSTWWSNSAVGHNREAKAELKALFPGAIPFATPKPERLLERVIHIATNPGDIVLDVFAGSGTTAAVAQKMGRRWVTCELIEDTVENFTRPRLQRVINGDEPGGVTRVPGERIAAIDVELPDGMTADEAQRFTSLLNRVIKSDEELKKSSVVKDLKARTKTTKTKNAVNWRGGGGFDVARLAPPCFDYDEELGVVTLTEAAENLEALTASVAANLRFKLTPEHRVFHGVQGRMRLFVTRTPLTPEFVTEIASHLEEGEGLTIASTVILDGAAQALRESARGSRVLHVPQDLFVAEKENAR
ncbi:site-specific DNA-methyltransferase [Arthrobacter antioxidans]|uniref:site-specific DNA-methyltransferase n=1 Tax=Arthrobacter antioxidans TaxID=2895818 RepID=UPI0020000011|nr:site-specific DNA-methyltransferase [Arthrobacter antioxidans]